MATITLISQLKQSSQGRSGTPDGNIYFNPNGTLELITAEELPQINFGSGNVANPLTNADGIEMRLLYAFERNRRRLDENLRELEVFIEGVFKFAGAYNFVNGRKLSTSNTSLGDDRHKIRGSGFIEYAANGSVDRIYFGVRSLGAILETSEPYYQLTSGGATTNFYFDGPINEVVQVFGSTANGDSGAGNFDNTSYLSASLRTWGQVHDRKTLSDSGISEMSGYTGALGIGERPNPYHNDYLLANVFGGSAVAPWSTMTFETLSSPATVAGLVNTDTSTAESGTFSARINNPGNGSLSQVVAFMDALALQDSDIDSGTGTRNGKRSETLYTLDTDGNVVLGNGIYITSVPVADRSLVRYVDNDGDPLVYETVSGGEIQVGANAAADSNAFYHMFYLDASGSNDFNTLDAVTVNDASGTPIKGSVSGRTSISWDFAYSTNSQAGFTGGTNRDVVVIVEGDGVATFAQTSHTITNSTSQVIVCTPGSESNI